jgi:hypothetical protein
MKLTRLFETTEPETVTEINQETFIELAAKHKALLLQADDGAEHFSVDDFASLAESLRLEHYECKNSVWRLFSRCHHRFHSI